MGFGSMTFVEVCGVPTSVTELAKTYLLYWVVYPALLFGPLLAVEEIRLGRGVAIGEVGTPYQIGFPLWIMAVLGMIHLLRKRRIMRHPANPQDHHRD